MIEEHEASYHQADYSPNEAVAKSFACFLDGDRALIPHKNRYARWMFLHSWLVPLVLLILAILFSTAAVIGAENQQVVATMIRVYGPRYAAQDCEDDWVRIDGVYYGRLICAVTLQDAEREGARYRPMERVYLVEAQPPEAEDVGAAEPERESETAQYLVVIDYTSKEWTSFVMSSMTIGLGIPLLLCLFVIGLLISTLARKVPRSLSELACAGRLQPGVEVAQIKTESQEDEEEPAEESGGRKHWQLWPRNWWSYAQDLERAVVHPIRFPFYIFWVIVIFYFAQAAVIELGATETDVIWSTVYAIVVILIGSFGFAYVLAFLLWYLFVIAGYLRRITPTFNLDIQPEHGDGCGGLQRLGQISLIIALVIILPTLVIAILWGAGALTVVDNLFFGALVILSCILILAPLAFFGPLWRVHSEMSAAKASYQDEAIANIAPFEQQLRQRIVRGQLDESDTQKLDRELTRLKALYPATQDFPTWPFSTGQLLTFLSSQFIAVVSIFTAVVEFGALVGNRFLN